VRPELRVALSEGSYHYAEGAGEDVEDCNMTNSSHVSPVKQEARKARINDLVKGSPALESRRMHDQYPQALASKAHRSKSQQSRRSQYDSRQTGKTAALCEGKEALHLLQGGPRSRRDLVSSSNSDTSMGSDQLNEDRNVFMRALLEGGPSSATVPGGEQDQRGRLDEMAQPTCTSMDASGNGSPARGGPAFVNPHPRYKLLQHSGYHQVEAA